MKHAFNLFVNNLVGNHLHKILLKYQKIKTVQI